MKLPLLLLLAATCAGIAAPSPFRFSDGDRVVLLGDTFIEREQSCAYLEERLTIESPASNVVFRNLGWSADTPNGISRASFDFDKPGKAFEKLKDQLATIRPNVVILGYGMASSFSGDKDIPAFKADLSRLMDTLGRLSTNRPVKFIILSPIHHENLGGELPDPTSHNRLLAHYTRALREMASARNAVFISLFDSLASPGVPLTENGIHLSAVGYLRAAEAVERGLGWDRNLWRVKIERDPSRSRADGATLSSVSGNTGGVRFELLPQKLVNPAPPGEPSSSLDDSRSCRIQIEGLAPGRYELKAGPVILVSVTEKELARGVTIHRGPDFDQAEALRQAILRKNQLYFNRWRPQNETYLFGFRKHEQGQNAKEIPMFDPLIEKEEQEIARLRVPQKTTYELVPAGPVASPRRPTPGAPTLRTPAAASTNDAPVPQFDVADGFEVNLFAQSPLLAKPIQMNFDPQGRLWVASSAIYPQIQPGQVADDKILVLEDTNGDGYAEKSTVFADGLFIPTGVEPGDGGVYIGQSTQLLFLKDTDGDGKADQKRIVLSGFGTEDTHHIVHTLRWGFDGQLYFDQSIYIHTHIETPNGVERLNSGGVWHLRPPSMKLGVFLRGFCNPWGHQFDEFGQSFVTDGAGNQGISLGIPGATYFTYADMRRELKSISPGNYPKFCGLELIRNTHFPSNWQGNAITCDFRAHRVVRFSIEEQGAGYVTHELPDLLRSTNVTFRPIDVKLGPDGALYIADWSNPIIQHGEVDFRDPRRDHEQGRIWRITAKGRPLVSHKEFVHAPNQALLNLLNSPNAFDQQQARRVLTERGPAIKPDLAGWAGSQTTDLGRLAALWMFEAIDRPEPALLEKVLNAQDGRIRAAAVRVLSAWMPRLHNPLALLEPRISDAHPRVRLEAVRAVAQIPTARAAELALSVLDKPMDPFLDYGTWLSINELARPWSAAVTSGKWNPDGREKQLTFALKSIEPAAAGPVLARVMQSRKIPRDGSGPWIELIGTAGDPALLQSLFDQTLRDGFSREAAVRALQSLGDAARQRDVKPARNLDAVANLFDHAEPQLRQESIRLAGAWKLKGFVPRFVSVASAVSTPEPVRDAAFDALREIGGKPVVDALVPLTSEKNPPALRRRAVLALAALNPNRATQPAVDLLLASTREEDAAELWRSLLGIKGSGARIAKALPRTGLSPVMAKAGLRAAREGGRNEPDLVWALTRGADLEAEAQALSEDEIKQLATTVMSDGDPARGEKLFRRKELNCFTCHAIAGVGGKVGPDLTSIGASAQPDYLVESVLYPNRKIKEGYHSVIVETRDGLEYSGILVSENTDQLILRDATDKETTVAKSNVQNRSTGNSLMPSGLVDQLSAAERLDLFRFLAELGKPGRFDGSKGNVARSWKLFAQTLELSQFGDEKVLKTDLADAQWKSSRSLVDGQLLKDDVAAVLEGIQYREPQAIYAAARFEVSKAEPTSLEISGVDGAPAWVDGKSVGPCGNLKPELSAGTHVIIVKLDAKKLPDGLRLQSPDATFLTSWK